MTDEAQDDDTIELSYEPCMADVQDGAAVIGDLVEFLVLTKAVAVQMREGQMWVLREDTLKWMKIEDVRKADQAATVTPIRKARAANV